MTTHAVRLFIAPDSGMTDANVQTAIDAWVSTRTKWESDWDATVRRLNTADDGSGVDYLQTAVRFTFDSATKDNLLQSASDRFANKVAWFYIVYHACDHDEADRIGCSWDERREWAATGVTPPPEVEALVPDAPTVVQA